jgi:hypothetical protein
MHEEEAVIEIMITKDGGIIIIKGIMKIGEKMGQLQVVGEEEEEENHGKKEAVMILV